MNQIIVIYGHKDCGKTYTLNFICQLLRKNGGESLSPRPQLLGDAPETFNYKGTIICVCPGGDTGDIVRRNFDYAYSHNADIILTASRTRGDSVEIINTEGRKNGIDIQWFQKSYEYFLSEDTQNRCNEEYANVIFAKL